ncbi:ankyrin repeat domain-containing protein [Wolbachia endosymbiont of Pentidionis agamae]|uniref:ankyrin repeat domain-containing protein n=1 Tax=Wolbachia endosymbiont of Pentidionis agamae TaxID=3110435 RepID=UPI002FD54E42
MIKSITKHIAITIGWIAVILGILISLFLLLFVTNVYTHKEPPISLAIRNNDVEEVKRLLEKLQIQNKLLPRGLPLHDAAADNRLEIVKLFLEYGADPNVDYGGTPLYFAASRGRLEVIDLLLKNGADPNIGGTLGTPMTAAMADGHIRVVKYLLEYGIDPNSHSSLITAIRYYQSIDTNKPEIVELLLQYGADPTMKDSHGNTPLHYAAFRHNKSYGP